jgi:hypothetical protein
VTYALDQTKFCNLTVAEFIEFYTGVNKTSAEKIKRPSNRYLPPTEYNPPNTPLPEDIDWRNAGVVTPVKNQGELYLANIFRTLIIFSFFQRKM